MCFSRFEPMKAPDFVTCWMVRNVVLTSRWFCALFCCLMSDSSRLSARLFVTFSLLLDNALQFVERIDGNNVPTLVQRIGDELPGMGILIESALYEENIQIAELREALDIDRQVNLVHFGADEENPCRGLHGMNIGKHVENDGGLADAGVSDNHVVHPFGQPLVAAQQIVEHGPGAGN